MEGLFAGVPALPNHFVGREALVDQLAEQLIEGERRFLAVDGLPGVGKTTLAVELAHRPEVLAHYRCGVLWAGLGPQADVASALAEWALALGEDIADEAGLSQRRRAVTGFIGQRRLLLVIDDAWDEDSTNALCCGGPNCCHLLTTRDQTVARAFADSFDTVPTLEEASAYTLLQELVPKVCEADPEGTRELARAVGGLPLALELLGGYLAQVADPLFADLAEERVAELADPQRRLALAKSRLGTFQDERLSLEAVIALSLEGLPAAAVEAFEALGAFAAKPETFSRESAEAVTGASPGTLLLLIQRNLLGREGQAVQLHQTIADVARRRLPEEARARHQTFYLALVNVDREDWPAIEAVYGQIKHAWQHLEEAPEMLEWVSALRLYQERRGLWEDQLAWYQRALAVVRRDGQQRDEATLLNNFGLVYHTLGDRERALKYFEQALLQRRTVGDRAGEAATLNNIGGVYHALGERVRALEYHEQALPLYRAVGDRAGEAGALNNIGVVYHDLDERARALEYYKRALPLYRAVGDRVGVAGALINIGGVYNVLGERVRALKYFKQALSLCREVGDRAREAVTFNHIGLVYNALGDQECALEYHEQALPLRRAVGDRAGEAATLNNIGLVYNALGERARALEYYKRALRLCRAVSDRVGEATTLKNIGEVYLAQGGRVRALKYLKQALPLFRAVGDRADEAGTLNNIGVVYNDLGEWKRALEYFKEALPLFRAVGDRADEAATRFNVAMIYRNVGRLAEAVRELEQVVELDRLTQNPDLDRDLEILNTVRAELYKAQRGGE